MGLGTRLGVCTAKVHTHASCAGTIAHISGSCCKEAEVVDLKARLTFREMSSESLLDSSSDDEDASLNQKRAFDKSMSAYEVASFLQEQGVPARYCTVFEGTIVV